MATKVNASEKLAAAVAENRARAYNKYQANAAAKADSKYNTSRYDQLYNDFEKKQKADAAKQKEQTTEDYNQKLKEAYISKMQNQRTLNDSMSKLGIRGGATETSTLKNDINYQSTRNDLNKEKARALQDIDDNASSNIFNYKQTNDAAKISYIEQREAEDRQIAQNEKSTEDAANLDWLQAKYGGIYNTTTLNNALKTATTQQEKAIIQARINYLTAYSKGY